MVTSRVDTVSLRTHDGVPLDARMHQAAGTESIGVVIQAHGITADLDEGGMFVRLAERLASSGFAVLRFSFRGHGRSGGSSRGVTIAGELLDFQAALDFVAERRLGDLSIVAASFGAVPTLHTLKYIENTMRGLVLWNPVLDLRHTFLAPELPWGKENFGPEPRQRLAKDCFLTVDGSFEMGSVLFDEFCRWDPRTAFSESTVPSLVVHGDHDSAVSYKIARDATRERSNSSLYTIAGSDHGFNSRKREEEAIAVTADWLMIQYGAARRP